ncbi:MAG: magnesium transporter CorA family protein [Anaerolinea sp.]|nr:magnesium transporter CorA family protein [Anaerolinea sp.]
MTFQQLSGERTLWINMVRPGAADVDVLKKTYPYIHPLNLEDMLSVIERPKIDDDPDYIFVVMQFPVWDARIRLSRAAEVDFLVGRGFIITVHDGVLKPLDQMFNDCRSKLDEKSKLLGGSAGHAFYTMIDRLVDYMFPILRKVEGNLRKVEEGIFAQEDFQLIRDIALVRRDIIALRRIIRHQVPILDNLTHKDRRILHEDLDEYFGDTLDHISLARDMIDEHMEVINGLADTADMLLNHRLNSIIRVLTTFSVILLPLTLISSIYGMNILLPFQDHPSAFGALTVIMIALVIAMVVYFRRRRWL